MNERFQQSHFMERVLSMFKLLQENEIDPERFMKGCKCPEMDSADAQAAAEMMRFMNEMPGGFLIYHADRGEEIIYANQAALQIFGCRTMWDFRLLAGDSFRGLVHPEDRDCVEQSIQRQIAENRGRLDYVEYRIIRRDGQIRWVEDYGHFVHSEALGDIFYVFLTDATDKLSRRMSERASLIQEGEDRIHALMEAHDRERASINREYLRRLEVIEGLSVNYESILYGDLDKDEALPYRLNKRISSVFGEKYQASGFSKCVSEYILKYVCPEDQEMVAKAIAPDQIRAKLSEHTTFYINYRIVDEDGPQFLQLRVVNVGGKEHISQIVLGCRRVDEEIRREMEQNQLLADALANANLAITAKNTFLSNMSHDMHTPLNAIFGFAALARNNIRNQEAVLDYLDRMEASGRQLLVLIDRVLALSDAESGESGKLDEACDLVGLAGEVFDFLRPQAEEKGIDFTLDCGGVDHSAVFGDPDKLKHLMLYLANNAVTYTPYGGKVSITLREEEAGGRGHALYRLEVSDNGAGISKEFLERIFDPRSRDQNTTLSGVHGIGLGLTIAKNIVDLLNGTIDAQSKPGQGNTFTATFRLQVQTPDENNSIQPQPAANPGNSRLLLVEDNEINREIETELLEGLGYRIETAVDGSVAVDMVRNARPGHYALVLMDIQMPVMNGWDAARAIRALEDPALAGIPIVALSANALESDIHKSLESGMDAHLAKPVDLPALDRTIQSLLHPDTGRG